MSKLIDLTGMKFGRLTVIERAENRKSRTFWLCKCDCGSLKPVNSIDMMGGRIISCGCIRNENIIKFNTTHGLAHTRLNSIWKSMRKRCLNPNSSSYESYGGRGITICEEWKNDCRCFYDWAIANGYADNLTIDRIDNNKGYSPENCRFATMREQANNTRHNVFLEFEGNKMTIAQWAREINVNISTVWARIKRGCPIEAILSKDKLASNGGRHTKN